MMDPRCDCPECTGCHERRVTLHRVLMAIAIVLLFIAASSIAGTMP